MSESMFESMSETALSIYQGYMKVNKNIILEFVVSRIMERRMSHF